MARRLIVALTVGSWLTAVAAPGAAQAPPAPAPAAQPGQPAQPGAPAPGARPGAPAQPGARPGAPGQPGAAAQAVPAPEPKAPSKVFRWVDKDGVVHYADTPPQGQPSGAVSVPK